MLNNFNMYKFESKNSSIHLMPSFFKLIWLLTFFVILFLCKELYLILALTFMIILIIELAHIDRKIYIKVAWSLKYLLIFIILIYFLVEKEPFYGFMMCLRIFNIVLLTTVLTLTTSPIALMEGIKKILSPLKYIGLPINRISFSIYLSLRFIPTIMDVGNKIMKSQASRGVDYNASNLKEKLLSLKTMLVPIFILTMKKADNLAECLEVRLYNIDSKRTYIKEEKIKLFDYIAIFMNVAILILLIIRVW